jgi:hypothetical protein
MGLWPDGSDNVVFGSLVYCFQESNAEVDGVYECVGVYFSFWYFSNPSLQRTVVALVMAGGFTTTARGFSILAMHLPT